MTESMEVGHRENKVEEWGIEKTKWKNEAHSKLFHCIAMNGFTCIGNHNA